MTDYFTLFGAAAAVCLLIAAPLSMAGVFLVGGARVSSGLAGSAAGALGVALALALGASAHHDGALLTLCGAVFAGVGLAFSARLEEEGGDQGAAWLFIAGSATAVLVAATTPVALAEVRSAFASGYFGARWSDAVWLAGAGGMAILLMLRYQALLSLQILDPAQLLQLQRSPRKIRTIALFLIGCLLGASIRFVGPLLCFALLSLPAMAIQDRVNSLRSALWLAPLAALLAMIGGLALSHLADLPVAESAAAALALLAAIARLWPTPRPIS